MSKTVLIADDSITARMVTKQCLTVAGYDAATIIEKANGVEALVAIKKHKPELVLTDLIMPEMEGTELLQKIKDDDKLKDIRVIVISSAGNEAKEQELIEMGAEAVICKPISPAKLSAVLNPPDGLG